MQFSFMGKNSEKQAAWWLLFYKNFMKPKGRWQNSIKLDI